MKKRKRSSETAIELSARYPFPTTYGDHFETPRRAYADLAGVLRCAAVERGVSPAAFRIYDPFYCEGACVAHLASLGFHDVQNPCEDFYASEAWRGIVDFDLLCSNPPYSGDHKEKILNFALACGRPWALLLPAYVVEKSYFPQCGAFFLKPRRDYAFDHPHGAGSDEAPFVAIWVVHLGPRTDHLYATLRSPFKLRDLPALVATKAVRGTKRPSPRQRNRRRHQTAGLMCV
ncbi:hypothetical protein CTAYLR_009484 [Chrysophaeum taylorii]|uniref:Uncharacterized protein n=1 Tax=Chrysophaeum taylorii TaxID=2483200 RepID=A0AAD7UJX0_9STRA|nr:hypothetical protein CTAYLR_009484 [Chrysophaeum taylorii]